MRKKYLSLAMAIAMLVSMALAFVGCQAPAATATSAAASSEASEAPADTASAEASAPAGDPVELTWLMGDPGVVPPDESIVEEALNKISVEKLNVKMKTLYVKDEAIKLALSSGDPWDIAFTCEWFNSFVNQAAAGYFADITDKVQTVTPDLYATMPEVVWEGAKVNGKVYAIPVKKDYAAEMYYRFDKALFVDDLKMTVSDKMGFADIESYLKAAKDAFTKGDSAASQAEYPLMLSKGGFPGIDSHYDMIYRDAMLGIPYSSVGSADETKIVVTLESKDFVDRLNAVRSWYQAGYINKDASTLESDAKYSAVKVGQGFYGADAIWTGADGYVQLISKFSGPYLSSSSIRGSMNAINANSANIDLALKYQELVNTNQEYRDTLRYGVLGTHWNKTAEGLAQRTKEGSEKYAPWAFSQGSYSLSTVEAAEGVTVDPQMWTKIFDSYKDAVATKSIGFSFDTTSLQTELAAIKVVKDKYWAGLVTGSLDPAETLPKMIKELEDAGLRTVQQEAQKQFDAFLAG